ncbi:MAG: lipid-A-disaccharide synthase [Chitinophagaceae bacterium]
MRYYIISGEASGDLHGSNLVRALQQKDPGATFRAWGGEALLEAGAEVVKHYEDLAFMGFWEVLANLKTIFHHLKFCKQDILTYQPDALILIDYPGFNLRIAKWAHRQGIRVIYYISPQVWAWKANRVREMKKTIDQMLVILPFERAYYAEKWNWEVTFVGHPLLDVVEQALRQPDSLPFSSPLLTSKKIVALLPGSRKQEILKKLPEMLKVSRSFQDYQFIVAQAPGIDPAFYENLLKEYPEVNAIRGQTYPLLKRAAAALVTSGTATLETALFGVPQIVCYKGNPISYQIARRILTIRYISLVNLILDKPVVQELIQENLTAQNLTRALEPLLHDEAAVAKLKTEYQHLPVLLRGKGNASEQAAYNIMNLLRSNK